MMKTFVINSLEEILPAAQDFVNYIRTEFPERKCVVFYANMGVGKTTFIKALCKIFKVKDEVSSPTFSIVNEYLCENGEKIYHFDLYRIKDMEEAMSTGAEEYIYGQEYCFIEWPEVLEPVLPENVLRVEIREEENGKRVITI